MLLELMSEARFVFVLRFSLEVRASGSVLADGPVGIGVVAGVAACNQAMNVNDCHQASLSDSPLRVYGGIELAACLLRNSAAYMSQATREGDLRKCSKRLCNVWVTCKYLDKEYHLRHSNSLCFSSKGKDKLFAGLAKLQVPRRE